MDFIDYVEIFLKALTKTFLILGSIMGIFAFMMLLYLLPVVIK